MSNFDYSKTMMMKLLLSLPDNKGGAKVFCDFDTALEIVKKVDGYTCGCPKIIYLVGWQYNGHDDKYPAFFEVNPFLRRGQDKTAHDSLCWLIDEAKKYNTTISLHINVTDAYPDSPLWAEYIANDCILKSQNNKPKCTGIWNGKKAYQVRADKEYKSGLFQKRVDRLLEYLPQAVEKTVHIDAFFVRGGKNTLIKKEKVARIKMINYFLQRGIDVTSEFIYREWNCGFRAHFGKSDTAGLIPAFWQPVYSRKYLLKYPANVLAGGKHCKSLTPDKSIEWLVYGNMHGEDIFLEKNWESKFIQEFATYNVPYFYLNEFGRQKIKGLFGGRKMIHSNGVVSQIKDKKITKDSRVLKCNNEVFMPLSWRENEYIFYSEKGGTCQFNIDAKSVTVFSNTISGIKKAENTSFLDGVLTVFAQEKTCLIIKAQM